MARVTVYVDPSGAGGAGHAFIALTDDNSNTHYYGYYADGNMIYSDGIIKDETLITDQKNQDKNQNGIADRIENSSAVSTDAISTEQYNQMYDYIQSRIANPGDYSLGGEVANGVDNCATFVRDVLEVGGIDNGYGFFPNGFGQDKHWNDWEKMTPEQRALALKNGYGPESFMRRHDYYDPSDIDGDGIPNDQDPDIDGDGTRNEDDPNPLSPDSRRSPGFLPGYDPATGQGYSPFVYNLDANGIFAAA